MRISTFRGSCYCAVVIGGLANGLIAKLHGTSRFRACQNAVPDGSLILPWSCDIPSGYGPISQTINVQVQALH
jgi:hypothetical protein